MEKTYTLLSRERLLAFCYLLVVSLVFNILFLAVIFFMGICT